MPYPTVNTADFTTFSGITMTSAQEARVDVMLDRARRTILADIDIPVSLTADETSDVTDAVCQLAWLYWEAEKAEVMEVLALPLSQLSLGTLFWTKSQQFDWYELWAVTKIMNRYGVKVHRRFVLEDEIGYPE